MKIIFFTKYTAAGASSRYRVYQYLSLFQQQGVEVIVKPLFTDHYIDALYANQGISKTYILRRYLQRIKDVLAVKKGTRVYLEYELLPYFPLWLEQILKRKGIAFIADYDDAIFHNYDRHANGLVRRLLGKKIAGVMKMAAAVVTGSEYLTTYAKNYQPNVIEIPTSVNYPVYKATPEATNDRDIFTIGWVGTPSSGKNILNILPALKQFTEAHPAKVLLIGFNRADAHHFEGLDIEVLPWEEEKEIGQIKTFDVGIMPLSDTPFNRGKCGFKLIQYMACGLPVIYTPLSANVNIDSHKANLPATDNNDWYKALETIYLKREYYRETVGKANEEIVNKYYNIQNNIQPFLQVFNQLPQ